MDYKNLSGNLSKQVTGEGKDAKNPNYGGLIDNIISGGGGAASRSTMPSKNSDPADKVKGGWPGVKGKK